MLVEASLADLSSAYFKFADEVPEEAQYGSLANPRKHFPSNFHALSEVALVGFCGQVLSCISSISSISASTLGLVHQPCSTRGFRARYQFSRSGKHDVGYVGGNVTDQ